MGPPSSTVAAPNIRVPDTIAERTSRMGKPPESEKKIGRRSGQNSLRRAAQGKARFFPEI